MFSPRHARVRHFARVINAPALSAIAELFLMNGDMCAWLYTGSPAMHSEKITLFEPESSRLKKAGAGAYSNSFIAIRRCGAHDEALAVRSRACCCVERNVMQVLCVMAWQLSGSAACV